MPAPRILVVDDDPRICGLLKKILERAGYEAHAVFSGEEALELLCREPFTVVITDLALNGMDGHELAAQIGQRFANVGVIVLTGYASQRSVWRAHQQGVLAFLTKPIDDPILVTDAVELALRRVDTMAAG